MEVSTSEGKYVLQTTQDFATRNIFFSFIGTFDFH